MVARKDCIEEAALVTSKKRGKVSENIAQKNFQLCFNNK